MAIKYILPGQKRQTNPSLSHLKYCVDAARSITCITRQLLSTNQAALLAAIEYHFPFTAVIVLELARLLPAITLPEDDDSIKLLNNYLRQAGERGNDSARDCLNMATNFGVIVTRLLVDDQMRQVRSAAIGPLGEARGSLQDGAQTNVFGSENILSSAQMILSNGMPLDVGILGQGQAAAYEELFSWFSP